MYAPVSNSNTKKYFTISEVATILSVSTSLIRFWEKEFKVLQPKKNKYGIRKYKEEDINKLKYIYKLVKEEGYSLKGAQRAITSRSKKLNEDHTLIVKTLKNIKSFLIAIKQQIK